MYTSPQTDKSIFQQYAPPGGVYDEVFDDARAVRHHAHSFAELLSQIGPEELGRRWEQSQRLVHENGFAFSGHLSPRNVPRPWELDALPLLISSAEWQAISAALQQRARLFNGVLLDVYGPQRLLKQGVLPRELIFSHPGFQRSYHGQQLPLDCFLHFYAADLARSPDGRWWVLADRTEAPSGLGYTLENRVVISRMLPGVFHQCQIQRLARFFIAAQETLSGLAAQHCENPHVVLLSQGPASRNYFEDAYLARYLGYTLVESGDLDVRNSNVMLKTLGGLLPVDVILRRQNSDQCDPLELGPQAALGVAGLTQAARAGNVAIANALGSGLVESPAFMAFLPQLCQALLGEDLRMPGVATWWCGQPEALDYVLKHLDDLVLYPAFRRRGQEGPTCETLNQLPRAERVDRIRSNPLEYAAQERVARSSVSLWDRNNLKPAHLALRAYLVRSADSYTVMPGALARTSSNLDPLEASIRRGEGSKDVWVCADSPVEDITLLDKPGQVISLRRGGADLPSRVADNLFWLGRQLERAESFARLLRATAYCMSGETRSSSTEQIPVLLRCLADQGQIEPGYALDAMRGQLPPISLVLPTAVFDANNPGCLRSVLDELFRIGSIVRDRMSLDSWRIIHRVNEAFQPSQQVTTNISDLLAMMDELILELAAFSGMVRESMTRTQAYRFLELGRRSERAWRVIKLVKNCFIPLPDAQGPVLETVLEIADSLMTYRSRYLANLQLAAVLDMLLTDETNPRSLAYQIVQIAELVEQLPRKRTQPGYSAEQRLATELVHSVRMVDIHQVADVDSIREHSTLNDLICNFEMQLPQLTEAISHRYLVHAGPTHQLDTFRPQ